MERYIYSIALKTILIICTGIRDFKFLDQFAISSDIVALFMEAENLDFCLYSFFDGTMGRGTSSWDINAVGETGFRLRALKLASDTDKKLTSFFFSIGKITVTIC